MKKVVVVAPTYNEEENIGTFIPAVFGLKSKLPQFQLHLVISDSHSTDKTETIVRKLMKTNKLLHFLDVKKRGLGLGLFYGLNYATDILKADYLVTMEADLSNNPNQIPDFVSQLANLDLVVGSRYTRGGQIINWSWWRRGLSSLANRLLMLLAATTKIHEFTNLYRAFRVEVWKDLRNNLAGHTGWVFVPAFIYESLARQYRISEIPIIYFDRFGGRSKMKTVSYTRSLLSYAISFRLKKIWTIS